MFGVIEGSVEVVVGDEVIETVKPGGIVGEMAVLEEEPRGADARAAGHTIVAEIDRSRFLFLVKLNPILAIEVMKVLSDRLRRTTKRAAGSS